jgi:hypothetical protein
VVGLDPSLVVLTEILAEQPRYNAETHCLEQTREVDLQAGTLTRGWQVIERPPVEPEPPEPPWVEFGTALVTDNSVNALIGTAATTAPVLHLMLGVGLGQAAQGDPRTFLAAWTAASGVGLVAPDLTAHVAALAATFDLPAEFVQGLNPQTE